MKPVVLYMPRRFRGTAGTSQRMPLELLALAGPLLEAGREVRIIDGNVEPEAHDRVVEACAGALCLGISSILGHQIADGAALARRVRSARPALPIVWGGWFPTTVAEPFFREGLADVVVRGQGEATFAELVERLEDGSDLAGTAGLTLHRDGELLHTPARKIVDINQLPPMPFDLLDHETYVRSDPSYPMVRGLYAAARRGERLPAEVRAFWYLSSWGCPNNCRFCCSPGVSGRRWTALKPERMAEELAHRVRRHRVDVVCFCDANVLASPRRALEYCRIAREMGLSVPWTGTGEPETLVRMGDDGVRTLAESGAFALFVGAESASRETLTLLNKEYDPAHTEACVELLERHRIVPILSYIVGVHGESERSTEETIAQCCRIKGAHPNVPITILHHLPLPGSDFYSESLDAGFREPTSLEGWSGMGESSYYVKSAMKALSPARERELFRLRQFYFRLLDLPWTKDRLGWSDRLYHAIARYRVGKRRFTFPVEYWAWRLARSGRRLARKVIPR